MNEYRAQAGSPYLLNTWYVAAWANEVSSKMLARQLLAQLVAASPQ